jgi:hypothetical protein
MRPIVRTSLILVFGAIPVLPGAALAGLGVAVGTALLPEGMGFAFLLWGAAGLYGAASLWFAAFDRVNTIVFNGLILGCIAILPLLAGILLPSAYSSPNWIEASFALGPLLTAIVVVAEKAPRIDPAPSFDWGNAWLGFSLCVGVALVLAATMAWKVIS